MGRRVGDLVWAQVRENRERISALAVRALGSGIAGSGVQSAFKVLLRDLLDIRSTGKRVVTEAIAEVSGQCGTVSQKPRLHALDHQVDVVVGGTGRPVPAVTILQVPPRSGSRRDRPFAVNEQHDRIVSAGRTERVTKVIIGLLPAAGGENPGHASFEARIQEERPKCLPALGLGRVSIAASLDVEPGAHQRVPPSPPRIQ